MLINKFNNNMGMENGYLLLTKFFRECEENSEKDSRQYHIGLKSLLNINSKNTVYTNDILTLAEGLSPRLLLMR